MRPTFFSSIGDRRRSCQPVHCREDFLFFSSFPAGQGQTAVVCCARPAIHMAEADLSLLFFFWRLRNAIDGRAPGVSWDSLGRKRWRGDGPEEGWSGIALAMLHSLAGENRWGPIATRGSWVFPPPARDLPRVPVRSSGQLWANRTWSARRPRCAFLRLQYLFPGRSATRGRLLMGMGLNGGDITTKSCSGVVGR